MNYRGRLAPSPTGYLHLGHAKTFWQAKKRADTARGTLVLRVENIDLPRCKTPFVQAIYDDLHWIGIDWSEGPDVGGPHAPYIQSERFDLYREAMQELYEKGLIYPCFCSRKDILSALAAPHEGEEEPVYPGTCLEKKGELKFSGVNWRFRCPSSSAVTFVDQNLGAQQFIHGKDFGDFVVWRQDGLPAYQLAVVVDDHLMKISEVVRGEDLLMSTARQLLLYEAFGWKAPDFYHCELMRDELGKRLAKRHNSLSLRALREAGENPISIQAKYFT